MPVITIYPDYLFGPLESYFMLVAPAVLNHITEQMFPLVKLPWLLGGHTVPPFHELRSKIESLAVLCALQEVQILIIHNVRLTPLIDVL